MHVKRSIGFIQLFFGIFLILSALFIIPAAAAQYAERAINIWAPKEEAVSANQILDRALTIASATIIFVVMIFLFGIMFALQGIINTRIGDEYDLPLPKFGIIFVIGFIAIVILVLIFRSIVLSLI